MENIPFSFSNEEYAGIHFVCFVTELLLLLLINTYRRQFPRQRIPDTGVLCIAHQKARKGNISQGVIAS
jgi:hypothetical protein